MDAFPGSRRFRNRRGIHEIEQSLVYIQVAIHFVQGKYNGREPTDLAAARLLGVYLNSDVGTCSVL
jgi:hypothetical protein